MGEHTRKGVLLYLCCNSCVCWESAVWVSHEASTRVSHEIFQRLQYGDSQTMIILRVSNEICQQSHGDCQEQTELPDEILPWNIFKRNTPVTHCPIKYPNGISQKNKWKIPNIRCWLPQEQTVLRGDSGRQTIVSNATMQWCTNKQCTAADCQKAKQKGKCSISSTSGLHKIRAAKLKPTDSKTSDQSLADSYFYYWGQKRPTLWRIRACGGSCMYSLRLNSESSKLQNTTDIDS